MKNTMNKHDVAKYHNMLDEDVSIKKISEALAIPEKVLKLFSPEIMGDLKVKAKKARADLIKNAEALRKKIETRELADAKQA